MDGSRTCIYGKARGRVIMYWKDEGNGDQSVGLESNRLIWLSELNMIQCVCVESYRWQVCCGTGFFSDFPFEFSVFL